VFKPALNFSYP